MAEGQFEPGSENHASPGDVHTHAIVSIAISLKRIADALSFQPGNRDNIFDYVRDIANKP